MIHYNIYFYNKCIFIADAPLDNIVSLPYAKEEDVDYALYLLEKNRHQEICLFAKDVERSWLSFQKHFSLVEAAGGLVYNKRNELLFIYRLDKWDLPKGKIEKGEKPEEAAIREVGEECGLNVSNIDRFFDITYHLYQRDGFNLKKTYWYLMCYKGEQEPRGQIEESITQVMWVPKHEWAKKLENSYKNIESLLKPKNNQHQKYQRNSVEF